MIAPRTNSPAPTLAVIGARLKKVLGATGGVAEGGEHGDPSEGGQHARGAVAQVDLGAKNKTRLKDGKEWI